MYKQSTESTVAARQVIG